MEFDSVPTGWSVRPIWSMFVREKNIGHPEETMLSVFRDHGVVEKNSLKNLNVTADNRNIYQLVDKGWLVVNRMKAWQGSVGISSYRGIVSGHYLCFRPVHEESSRYLNWLLRSAPYTADYSRLSRGVRPGQAEIDNDQLRVLQVLLPPMREQRRIADFLDDQVALLDRAINLRQRQKALAYEHFSVLVESDVNRLRPTSRKLAHVLDLLRDGSHTPPPRVDDGVPLLTAKNVKDNRFQFTDADTRVSESDANELDRSLKAVPGDLLFSIKGSVGNVAVVPEGVERFVFERNLALFRPRTSLCSADWLYYVLRSRFLQDQVALGMAFSAQPGIYLSALAQLRVPVPPLDVQHSLVACYQEGHDNLGSLLILFQDSERLLRQRKHALITAAVTGEFDVTTARSVA